MFLNKKSTSSSQPDIVVVGAGHNTLGAAAYLAKCGLSVLVLEKNDMAGGGAISREVTLPGFVHDVHATGVAHLQSHPIITQDELGLLSKYDLKFVFPKAFYCTLFDDGDTLITYTDLDRTCNDIAKYSQKDAARYREMVKFMEAVGPMIGMSMGRPPVSFGSFVGFLEKTPFGNDLILAMMKSAYDVVIENFEHPKVRIHFLKWAAEAVCAPEEKTTGINMFFLIGGSHSHPAGAVVGGTGNMTRAMIACIEDNGGEVRLNSKVERVINKNGEAKSVQMADGSVITAKKAVIAAIHPHLLGDKVEGLDAGMVQRAKQTHSSSYAEMTIHAALKDKVQWKAGAEIDDCLAINLVDYTSMENFRRIFDGFKYGELPKHFIGSVGLHTNYDKTRAPAGQHTFYMNMLVPFDLKDGGSAKWDEIKESFADWSMNHVSKYAHNLDVSNIQARYVESPLDFVRHTPSFQRGDIMGLGSYIYQSLGMRPTPELAQYRVPGANGLYLSGPFMHPGGGITGGGRPVAIRIMEDLKVDYSKVIRS